MTSAVLETIAETAKSQFKLQHTVEGLSTVAITYYFLGIVDYALAGPLAAFDWDKTWTISILAPVVPVATWMAMRRVRQRVHQES